MCHLSRVRPRIILDHRAKSKALRPRSPCSTAHSVRYVRLCAVVPTPQGGERDIDLAAWTLQDGCSPGGCPLTRSQSARGTASRDGSRWWHDAASLACARQCHAPHPASRWNHHHDGSSRWRLREGRHSQLVTLRAFAPRGYTISPICEFVLCEPLGPRAEGVVIGAVQ